MTRSNGRPRVPMYQACPRCPEGRQKRYSLERDLKPRVKDSGLGVIFKCSGCGLPIRIGGYYILEKPELQRRGSSTRKRRPSSGMRRSDQAPNRPASGSRKRPSGRNRPPSQKMVRPSGRARPPSERMRRPPLRSASSDSQPPLKGAPAADDTVRMTADTVIPSDVKAIIQNSVATEQDTIDERSNVQQLDLAVKVVENKVHRQEVLQDRFKLKKQIGKGSEGIVVVADDLSTGKQVAVKFFIQTAIRGDSGKEARGRVMRSYELQSMVHSSSAVRPLALIEDDFVGLITVEEFVDGKPLNEALRGGKTIKEGWAIDIGIQVLSALSAAWQVRKIVHRDIKPANLMVADDGNGGIRAKVVDWGICRSNLETAREMRGFDPDQLTESGELDVAEEEPEPIPLEVVIQTYTMDDDVLGSPAYMPPEQVDKRRLDVRSDMYALGATLYHAVTGRAPFYGATLPDLLRQVLFTQPDDPRQAVPELSKEFAKVLLKVLAKEPGSRFQTPEEMREALEACRPSSNSKTGSSLLGKLGRWLSGG